MTTWSRACWLAILSVAGVALPAVASAETGPAPAVGAAAAPSQNFRAAPGESAPRARSVTGPDNFPAAVRAIFFGATGGVGYATFRNSELTTTKLVAPMVSFQLGYRITPRWAVSLVYTDFSRGVSRASGGELFATSTSLLRTQLDCPKCTRPGGGGGSPLQTTFRLSTMGAGVDVTPFGKNGPFLGVAGGAAMSTATETAWGYSGTARGGVRVRPVDNVSLGLEGGVQGQSYQGGSAALAYGAAEMRLSF